VKVAGFAGLVRVFWVGFGSYVSDWQPLIAGLAVLSLLLGSLLALAQTNVKRMLAYSSISHAGFMLVAVHAAATSNSSGLLGSEALLFYLLAYTIMVAGTFGVVTIIAGQGDGHHEIDDYRGLSRRYPVLAAMMAVLLFSQAGVPFTSGFFAKFRVIVAAAEDQSYVLAGIAMLAAVVSAVLYLRIVVSMFLIDTGDTHAGGGADAVHSDERPDLAAGPGGLATAVAVATVQAPALSAVIAVAVAAAVTVLLGLLPDLGGGVLADAAEALNSLRQ
jgi:NADH-quinone oxidoreductase subunit N